MGDGTDYETAVRNRSLRPFTAETKKKKEKSYQYYRCSCNEKRACDNEFISGITLENLLNEEIISKLVFDEDEMNLLKTAIEIRLESEGKLQEDVGNLLRKKLGRLEGESERNVKVYVAETLPFLKEKIRDQISQLEIEIEETKNRLANLPAVSERNAEMINEPLSYAKELATNFKNFPPRKKR